MDKKYTIGIDFGTESGRAVIVDIENGEELAAHVTPYPYGVMNQSLPGSSVKLDPDWALQHPDDYLEVLRRSVPEVLRISGVSAEQVIGLGIDFTSCTILPIDANGIPLCYLERFQNQPHAFVKLWKHHAAQEEADKINDIAQAGGFSFLRRYGGKTSSEWMVAKVWQVLNEAPEIYAAADQFLEAADWVVLQMTGNLIRSSCSAGYKALWHKGEGYPSPDFFRQLDPRLEHFTETKLRGPVVPIGTKAGELTAKRAEMMGLLPGTAVAVGIIDAHAAVPAVGVSQPGQLVMAMGTSLCHMILSDKEIHVEGISGVVEDGIIPGLYGYEAGQPAVGDIFNWFVEQAVPEYVAQKAKQEGLSIHSWLEERASKQKPGQHGLLALDWWNGNRSVLVNADLSGLIIGMSLQTKPEDIYRSLIEATAFGTRKIIDTFNQAGIEVHELYACGGLPQRNKLLMQIYADVTGKEITVASSTQTTAVGAAMFGAVAAGPGRGGYESIEEASAKMARVQKDKYRPIAEHTAIYNVLYQEYLKLYDLFGRGSQNVMKVLKQLKLNQESEAVRKENRPC